MIKEGRIGVHGTVCLVVIAMSNKVLFSSVSRFADFTATSAWLMTLISCASACVLFGFVYLLLKRFPGKNLMEIFDAVLGRAVGFVFSFTFVIAILFCCAMLLREFADVCREYVFPNTPPSMITTAMLLPVVMASYFGLESITRFAKITAYFSLTAFVLVIAMDIPNFNTSNIFPVMGFGIDVTLKQGLMLTCTYSEVIFIAILASSLQGIKHVKKSGYFSLVISGLIISIGLFVSVLVLSYPLVQEQMSPLYVLARQISIGEFFQRMDPLFLFLWFVTTIITVGIEFYCAISVYSKAFRLQNHRPIILPAAVAVYAVSFIPKDFTVVEAALLFIRTYGIFVVFGMPIIALVVSLLRKKKGAPA
jgi:spore germination protein (amino acid permease)